MILRAQELIMSVLELGDNEQGRGRDRGKHGLVQVEGDRIMSARRRRADESAARACTDNQKGRRVIR